MTFVSPKRTSIITKRLSLVKRPAANLVLSPVRGQNCRLFVRCTSVEEKRRVHCTCYQTDVFVPASEFVIIDIEKRLSSRIWGLEKLQRFSWVSLANYGIMRVAQSRYTHLPGRLHLGWAYGLDHFFPSICVILHKCIQWARSPILNSPIFNFATNTKSKKQIQNQALNGTTRSVKAGRGLA